jgi:dCTP deaminase
MQAPPRGSLLVDHELRALLGSALLPVASEAPIEGAQLQPASLDLRLGRAAHRLRAGFLPERAPIERRIRDLGLETLSLEGEGAVLERGSVYLIQLQEELALPSTLRGRFNPRSSTGRCDIFTRVLCEGHARFDEAPPGYRGKLWLEVSSLSFDVRLRRGDRLAQLRLQRGNPALGAADLHELHRATPLCFEGSRPLSKRELQVDHDGCLVLSLGLAGRTPAGWKARPTAPVVETLLPRSLPTADFWEPVASRGGQAILEPESFYIFASREQLRIPPLYAAEMLPVDVGVGELRNNYAGFFDSGFGWHCDEAGEVQPRGTAAVLEVRAHDVPFLVEDGQAFCRLRFFAMSGEPEALYGEGRSGPSYQHQDLTLARVFQ